MNYCTTPVIRSWVPGSTVDPAVRLDCSPVEGGNIFGPAYTALWAPIVGGLVLIIGSIVLYRKGAAKTARLRAERIRVEATLAEQRRLEATNAQK